MRRHFLPYPLFFPFYILMIFKLHYNHNLKYNQQQKNPASGGILLFCKMNVLIAFSLLNGAVKNFIYKA